MPDTSTATALLPPSGGAWEPVLGGESGARVFVDRAGDQYAKIVPVDGIADLAAERERTLWLDQTPLPSAAVLDWRESDAGACLVTRALLGVPANELDSLALQQAWRGVAEVVRDLHSLDVGDCPFDRGIDHMMGLAEAQVAADRVVTGFLPVALQQTPPQLILDGIRAELPERHADERADLVVCHGDLCLPNVLIDPATSQVAGLIDLGRLGTADPYGDLALLLATARETWSDEAVAGRAEQRFEEVYGVRLDAERRDFYLRLDPLTW